MSWINFLLCIPSPLSAALLCISVLLLSCGVHRLTFTLMALTEPIIGAMFQTLQSTGGFRLITVAVSWKEVQVEGKFSTKQWNTTRLLQPSENNSNMFALNQDYISSWRRRLDRYITEPALCHKAADKDAEDLHAIWFLFMFPCSLTQQDIQTAGWLYILPHWACSELLKAVFVTLAMFGSTNMTPVWLHYFLPRLVFWGCIASSDKSWA